MATKKASGTKKAATKKASAPKAPAAPLSRSHLDKHQALADFIETKHGVNLASLSPAQIIGHAFANRNAFRKTSSEYKSVVAARGAAKAQKAAERTVAKKAAGATKATKAATKAAKAAAPAKRASRATKAAATEDPFA